jgi:hypothetical protein
MAIQRVRSHFQRSSDLVEAILFDRREELQCLKQKEKLAISC